MPLKSNNLEDALSISKDILLAKGTYILKDIIYINEPFSIAGEDNVTIIGTFIINSPGGFYNINFINNTPNHDPLIFLQGNFSFKFERCSFIGTSGFGIYSTFPYCNLYFIDCSFSFLEYAITTSFLENIRLLESCLFSFVSKPIKLLHSNSNESLKCICPLKKLFIAPFYKYIPNLLSQTFVVLHIINQKERNWFGNGFTLMINDSSQYSLCNNSIKGGILMAQILEILTISNVNPKSLDLQINQKFDGSEIVEVFESATPTNILASTLVKSSLTLSDNVRTLIFSPILLSPTVDYTLKITKGSEILFKAFSFASFGPMTDVQLTTFGTCLAKFSFPYPVNKLLNTVVHPGGQVELSNMYFLYFGLDTDVSEDPEKQWLGYVILDDTHEYAFQSPDLRTLIIQYNGRGIPIGDHKVMVNYSKHQGPTNIMEDFSTPPRLIPIIEENFSITTAYEPTSPTSVEVISRTEVIVTFDHAVLLKPSKLNALSVNGVLASVASQSWADYSFTKIRYILNDASALPIGDILVTVHPIYNAYGFLTSAKDFNVKVVAIPPTITKVAQVEYPANPATTEIDITFSTKMNFVDPGSASNKNYYHVYDSTLDEKSIISVTRLDDYNVRMVIEFLEAGNYLLTASQIKDFLGLEMLYTERGFKIVDNTVPDVEEIIAANGGTSFVIKFNEAMSIAGLYSAIDPVNFMISKPAGDYPLPSIAPSLAMSGNKWSRFTLPVASPILPFVVDPAYLVHIGYPRIKDVLHVNNASGNIYPLCKTKTITRLVNPLSIVNGLIRVTSDSSFAFEYSGSNEFYGGAFKSDFTVTFNGSPIPILNTEMVDSKTLLFTFAANTFDSSSTAIVLSTIAPVSPAILATKDVFGNPIVSNVSNNTVVNSLRSKIKGISLVDVNGNIATLNLKFTENLQATSPDDFTVKLNGSTVLFNDSASVVTSNPDTVALNVVLPAPLVFTDVLTVTVDKPTALIMTVDINDNKIQQFVNEPAQKFTVKSIAWKYSNPAAITNDTLSITFNGKVLPSSLVPGWDGTTPRPIAPGEVTIKQTGTTATSQIATIAFNVAPNPNLFGNFLVYSPTATPFVPVGSTVTSAFITTASLSVDIDGNSVLSLKFNGETMAVNIAAVTYALYNPKPYTMNSAGTLYINLDYTPTTKPAL